MSLTNVNFVSIFINGFSNPLCYVSKFQYSSCYKTGIWQMWAQISLAFLAFPIWVYATSGSFPSTKMWCNFQPENIYLVYTPGLATFLVLFFTFLSTLVYQTIDKFAGPIFSEGIIIDKNLFIPKDLNYNGYHSDINGDGKIDMEDVAKLEQIQTAYTKGELMLTRRQKNAFDFDRNGVFDENDVDKLEHIVKRGENPMVDVALWPVRAFKLLIRRWKNLKSHG